MGALIEINLDGLSEPATALINRVSDAVGGAFEPWQIGRVTKANNKAAVDTAMTAAQIARIQAQTGVEVSEIEARGTLRRLREDGKDQANIESVTAKAIPFLSSDASPKELDEDFIRYLFEKARIISNEEMQTVWAKILAGEANKTGSFSRRTLETVAQMSRSDAELFTRFCGHVWQLPSNSPCAILFSDDDYKKHGVSEPLNFDELSHLESIGLIQFDNMAGYIRHGIGKRFHMHYFYCPVLMEFEKETNNAITVGNTMLTKVGEELASLSGAVQSKSHFEFALSQMIEEGVNVSIPITAREIYPIDA